MCSVDFACALLIVGVFLEGVLVLVGFQRFVGFMLLIAVAAELLGYWWITWWICAFVLSFGGFRFEFVLGLVLGLLYVVLTAGDDCLVFGLHG